jgi:hypothetical protein
MIRAPPGAVGTSPGRVPLKGGNAMSAANAAAKIIQFPDVGLWSQIAKRYVDYMTSGDPRAAFYYLDYKLNDLKLSAHSTALEKAIQAEFKRRGFSRPISFSNGT